MTVGSTGSGHLLVMHLILQGGAISGVPSGGGSWVCPAGANIVDMYTCYVLSSSSGVTTITATAATTGTWRDAGFYEIAYTGSTSLDTDNAVNNSTSSASQAAPSLTLSGSQDFILQGIYSSVVISSISGTWNFNTEVSNTRGTAYLLNAASYTAPTWTLSSSGTCLVNAIAFK
jgi:hypothetical protein